MNQKSRLLIIITRMYANKMNMYQDEFVGIWKQVRDKESEIFTSGDRNILLIHGWDGKYSSAIDTATMEIEREINDALNKKEIALSQISGVGILFHPEPGNTTFYDTNSGFPKRIRDNLKGWKIDFAANYSSTGNEFESIKQLANRVVTNQDIAVEFDNLWNSFTKVLDIEDALESRHKMFVQELSLAIHQHGEGRHIPNILILWNNNVVAEIIKQVFDEKNVVIANAEFEDKIKQTSAYIGIVLLAELNWSPNSIHNLSELYGIELAQKIIRAKYKLKCPILFVSFLDLKEILQNPKNKIVAAVGHDFIRLPSPPEQWQELINNMPPLTDLQFIDVVNNFCNLKGLVGEIIHRMQGDFHALVSRPNEAAWATLKSKLESGLKEIANLLGSPTMLEFKMPEIIRRFHADIIDRKNLNDADNFVARMGDELKALVADEGENEKSVEVVVDLQMPWQVLILDDEPDSLKPIVDALHARGISPVVANNFAETEQKIAADVYNKIVVAISDYRLLEHVDGIQKLQRKQGYDFLFDLSKQERFISLVALSGMNRRFLLESFQKYNTRVAVFSKNDLVTPAAANLFADRILEMGSEVYEVLCSQPQGAAWQELKKFYVAHRQSHDYTAKEIEISQRARSYAMRLESLLRSESEELLQLPALPLLENLQAKMNRKAPSDANAMEQFHNKLMARRIALWLYFVRGFDSLKIYHALNGRFNVSNSSEEQKKDGNNAKALINTNLALSFSDFPAGLLVEEKKWLKYDMGVDIKESEDELLLQISYHVQVALEKWLRAHPNMAKKLKSNDDLVTNEGKPNIANRVDAQKLLLLIEKKLLDGAQRKEYCDLLDKLLRKIREDRYSARYFSYYEKFITPIKERLTFK